MRAEGIQLKTGRNPSGEKRQRDALNRIGISISKHEGTKNLVESMLESFLRLLRVFVFQLLCSRSARRALT